MRLNALLQELDLAWDAYHAATDKNRAMAEIIRIRKAIQLLDFIRSV